VFSPRSPPLVAPAPVPLPKIPRVFCGAPLGAPGPPGGKFFGALWAPWPAPTTQGALWEYSLRIFKEVSSPHGGTPPRCFASPPCGPTHPKCSPPKGSLFPPRGPKGPPPPRPPWGFPKKGPRLAPRLIPAHWTFEIPRGPARLRKPIHWGPPNTLGGQRRFPKRPFGDPRQFPTTQAGKLGPQPTLGLSLALWPPSLIGPGL